MDTAVVGFVLLGVLWVVWHFLWKDYALDALREDLFAVRNRLFDIAHEKQSALFSNSLYVTFEKIINNAIRHGHRLSFFGAILFGVSAKIAYPKYKIKSRIQGEYENLDSSIHDRELKESIITLKRDFEITIVRYLLKTSICFVVITAFLFFWSLIRVFSIRFMQTLFKRATDKTEQILSAAILNDIEYQAESLNRC